MIPTNATLSMREREEALFERWQEAIQGPFIRDGVVDEAKYLVSPRRLLFVLKEANSQETVGWNLREEVARGPWAATWNNITRWTRAIHALPEELPWRKLSEIGVDERVESLNKIAFMNLNKRTGGGGVANMEVIKAAVHGDREFVQEQIGIYDAGYTICCGEGVFDLTTSVIFGRSPNWQETERGVRFVELPTGGYLIDYWHPQYRVPTNLLCFHLADAIREIEAKAEVHV